MAKAKVKKTKVKAKAVKKVKADSPEFFYDKVIKASKAMKIMGGISLAGLTPEQAYMCYSRALNLLYSEHFKLVRLEDRNA